MITLTAEKRDALGKKAGDLKADGKMPAVVYGPKQAATSIVIELRAFEKAFKTAGESSVLELGGLGAPMQVLIHDVDHDPVTNVPRHADFYAIEKGAKIEVAVPLVFVGEAPAEKAGANIVKVMHEVEIEADAAHLPHDIQVDISGLAAIDDQIHAKDLVLPSGVALKTDGDEVIALAQEVKEEVEEAPAAVDMGAIEVEKKGKEEGAEGEAAAE
jgi:large subunit ribosomal protein L25